VIDPIAAASHAVATKSAWAPVLALAAGAATSLGPCVAPRFIAVAAFAGSQGTGRWKWIALLTAGLCVSYVAIGLCGGALARIAAFSPYVYACAALASLGFGTSLLLLPVACEPSHVPSNQRVRQAPAFALGASFAMVTSPCCTPAIVLLGSLATMQASLQFGALCIGAYALGHALPLAAAGFGWQWAGARALAHGYEGALQTVAGALMIALGGYYGLLA